MKLSTRSRYSVRIVLDLALSEKGQPKMMKDIARQQEISHKYAHNLLTALRDAGYVKSVRGARGGYALAKTPGEVRLGELLQLMEGTMAFSACVFDPRACKRSADCIVREVWTQLGKQVLEFLNRITLADLVKRHQHRHAALMYYI